MNQREKLLAVAVGVLLSVAVLMYAGDWVFRQFRQRRNALSELQLQVDTKERIRRNGRLAMQRVAAYRSRSLPGNPDYARSLYQEWLFQVVTDVGLANPAITAGPGIKQGDVYQALGFRVAGRGTLDQITRLIHRFYSANHLHRVSQLLLTPALGTKQLDLVMSVEALVVAGAAPRETLDTQPSERLAMNDLSDYQRTIAHRNIFAPANRAPSVGSIGEKKAERGQMLSVQISANDPDPLDKLTYRLFEGAPTGAQVDASSGQFRWTPNQLGSYEMTVEISDDGLPAQVIRETFKVTVVSPQAPTESLADAKFTEITGITDGEQRHLWLVHHTSGKRFKLEEGDDFQAGQLKGTVKKIGRRDALLVVGERVLRLAVGKTIDKGEEITEDQQKELEVSSARSL